jgi:hypothetical protein
MATADMKYTFIDDHGTERSIKIPGAVLTQGKREGLSVQETCLRYLEDEGLIENEEVAKLTAKAKANKAGVTGERKPRKAPTRKPDDTKRALIEMIHSTLLADENSLDIKDVEILKVERLIAFAIGEDKYEITLSKKRKPKA